MGPSATILGKRLQLARQNSSLTQEAAAAKVGINRATLAQIEAGNRPLNNLEKLVALAELYRVELSVLLSTQEDEGNSPFVALCRLDPHLANDQLVKEEIEEQLSIFQEGVYLERLVEDKVRSVPPAYDFPEPKNYLEAVEQGQTLATQERGRLNLGIVPISNIADLIASQGIWATTTKLPNELSGLFLNHLTIGMAILVNNTHTRGRCRFSYAHEYAHALVDRKRLITITSKYNANELIEKRANAFASEFLMPSAGVEEALEGLNRGGASRQSYCLYDVANDSEAYVEKRVTASSQKILSQDVALIAHEFQVSYLAAAYKLSDMRCISRQELGVLLQNQKSGKDFLAALKLLDPEREFEDSDERLNLTGQIGRLAVEAFRRSAIDKHKLLSICKKLNIQGEKLLELI
jgi:Zn-dependent peptidase ImmA (M78 family)/transcriptional regulator with XRE-family HTH domain